MKLSPSDKAQRERERLRDKAREMSVGTYCRKFVAVIFQRMIRAEAAAQPTGLSPAIMDGELVGVPRWVGQCVCITCGKVKPWNVKGLHAGHWIGRVHRRTLFESDNVAPQCDFCNEHHHGRPHEYRQWMLGVRGIEVIERLESLKRQSVSWDREQLVDMRIEFSKRLKAAEAKMKG